MTMMKRLATALRALGLGLTLGGCGLGVVTQDREIGPLPQSVARAAIGGRQPVVIAGAPADGAAPEAIAAALRSPARYGPTRYYPAEPGIDGPRLVLEFGRRVASSDSCVSPSGSRLEAGLTVAASLCQGERLRSTAALRAEDIGGPSDPRFEDAMGLLLRRVLEPEDRRERFGLPREDD